MPGESALSLESSLHAMRNWLLPLNAEICALTARARGHDPDAHSELQIAPADAVAAFVAQNPQHRPHQAGLVIACGKMPSYQLALSRAKWRELCAQTQVDKLQTGKPQADKP